MHVSSGNEAIRLPRCENVGKELKYCHESCSTQHKRSKKRHDGKVCKMEIHLDKCTCNGISISLKEVTEFDLKTQRSVSIHAPFSRTYGSGYTFRSFLEIV